MYAPASRRSFPRKRESTPQTFGNALFTNWIPAPRLRGDKFRGNDRRFVRDDIRNDTNTPRRIPATNPVDSALGWVQNSILGLVGAKQPTLRRGCYFQGA